MRLVYPKPKVSIGMIIPWEVDMFKVSQRLQLSDVEPSYPLFYDEENLYVVTGEHMLTFSREFYELRSWSSKEELCRQFDVEEIVNYCASIFKRSVSKDKLCSVILAHIAPNNLSQFRLRIKPLSRGLAFTIKGLNMNHERLSFSFIVYKGEIT
jgi:hypothetical protein